MKKSPKIELPLDAKIDFLSKFSSDFENFVKNPVENVASQELSYTLEYEAEPTKVARSARKAALQNMQKQGLVKLAFDTRRIDQEAQRNPRANLQYWSRSEPFIDEELSQKITIFSKLMSVLQDIKQDFGTQPEYFESYSRVLFDQVERILRIKQGDLEISRPQVSYLEQLLYARYRLNMDELEKIGFSELKNKILSKDESLLKRGKFLTVTEKQGDTQETLVIKDGNSSTQEGIIQAIFGNNGLRREGEKSATRTITITIKDTTEE